MAGIDERVFEYWHIDMVLITLFDASRLVLTFSVAYAAICTLLFAHTTVLTKRSCSERPCVSCIAITVTRKASMQSTVLSIPGEHSGQYMVASLRHDQGRQLTMPRVLQDVVTWVRMPEFWPRASSLDVRRYF